MAAERKPILLRLDPAVHDALARWAADELRSTNAQIEMVLRRGLAEAGRLPAKLSPLRGPGRPRKEDEFPADSDSDVGGDEVGLHEPMSTAVERSIALSKLELD
jgi:hypothetical protein